ncbi:hypothetical protein BC749_10223 [Flavobacterium araucananum]|nr:hypothetical protein BC749_10223 [Flavobacterium araucananum]
MLCGASYEDFSLRRNDKDAGYFARASTSLSLTKLCLEYYDKKSVLIRVFAKQIRVICVQLLSSFLRRFFVPQNDKRCGYFAWASTSLNLTKLCLEYYDKKSVLIRVFAKQIRVICVLLLSSFLRRFFVPQNDKRCVYFAWTSTSLSLTKLCLEYYDKKSVLIRVFAKQIRVICVLLLSSFLRRFFVPQNDKRCVYFARASTSLSLTKLCLEYYDKKSVLIRVFAEQIRVICVLLLSSFLWRFFVPQNDKRCGYFAWTSTSLSLTKLCLEYYDKKSVLICVFAKQIRVICVLLLSSFLWRFFVPQNDKRCVYFAWASTSLSLTKLCLEYYDKKSVLIRVFAKQIRVICVLLLSSFLWRFFVPQNDKRCGYFAWTSTSLSLTKLCL